MVPNPILLDIPENIQTERLILRAPQVGDGLALSACVTDSHDHLKPWMPWVDGKPTPAESEENLRRARVRFLQRTELRYHVWLDEKIIGCVGMHNPDWRIPALEMGYWIHPSYEGQGYVTEAMTALVGMAKDTIGARRLCIKCDAENARSIAVPIRLGFELEGRLRGDDVATDGSGELRDTVIYGLLMDR